MYMLWKSTGYRPQAYRVSSPHIEVASVEVDNKEMRHGQLAVRSVLTAASNNNNTHTIHITSYLYTFSLLPPLPGLV